MEDIQIKAEQKIQQLLNNIYQTLAKHPVVSEQERQLLQEEEQLMANLNQNSFLYQSLLRALAIDSYSAAITNQLNLYDQLSGMLTATLEAANGLGQAIRNSRQNKQIGQNYNKTIQTLIQCIRISQEIWPKNPYSNAQKNLLETALNGNIESNKKAQNIQQQMLRNLRVQNQQLRKKAQTNQIQILNMENKLTKLLKEHQGCERAGNAGSKAQFREQIALKQAEIERMNQEFSFQIQKYNTVFQAMKRQLQEMKGYQNVDLIQQIELLETEIVRLRQERERDQIIIRQLRSDNSMFSSPGYYSPRHSGSRYPNPHPRYNY